MTAYETHNTNLTANMPLKKSKVKLMFNQRTGSRTRSTKIQVAST